MNWAYFGLTVSAALLAVWSVAALRARPQWQGVVVGLAMLLVAGMNGAAPVRGLVDPDYVGFHYGLFSAEKGIAVTLVAGGVFLLAASGAFAALRRSRRAKAVVAGVCLLFLGAVGAPWLSGALSDIESNTIQFGEYLSTVLLFVLIILPFVIGLLWAGPSALSRGKVPQVPKS
jgi:hypothetical protein